MSIRLRFTLLFAVIVGIIIFFFSFAIYYFSEDYRQNDFKLRLQERAIIKLKLFLEKQGETENANLLNEKVSGFHSLKDEKIVIYDSDKKPIYRDSNSFTPSFQVLNSVKKGNSYLSSKKGVDYIGFVYPHNSKKYMLFASAKDVYGMSFINNLRKILVVRGLLIMLIIFFSGWLYAGRFLKPISNIIEQTDKINYSNLSQRLRADNMNDEIGRLTTTFNHMLERLETSFKIQKRFVSNASHELRNPLTAITGQIDVALLKDREPKEYKAVLQSISKDIKNVRVLANNLLELANSEVDTLFKDLVEVRIDEILWDIRDEMIKQKSENILNIHFEKIMDDELSLTCKGKEKLLKTAFLNIIDNACKYSNDKTVDVKIIPEKTDIVLFFIDKGIGMPKTYLEHIFEPFFRGSNAHGIPGSGIGLSLVQRIIKLHSGKIFVRSKINKGTTVEVVLPNLRAF